MEIVKYYDIDKMKNAKIRVRGMQIIPYTEIDLKIENKMPITSIGVGPGFLGEEDRYAVRMLCKQFGYDPEIYSAETPYRRLTN
jgi:hypothetical protein